MRTQRTATTYRTGPTQLEQPVPTLRGRHDPTRPTAGQAGHSAAQTMTYQPRKCQQLNNHTRGQPETGHTAKQHPRRETSHVGTTTATRHGQPGPYRPPRNPDGLTTGEQTPANQHHAPGTPRSRRIRRARQAGRHNPQNKPGRQRKPCPTTSARATQLAADQTAGQRPDNVQTTRKPANTQPARHARVETGTASHGLSTTCCAAPADRHANKDNRTLRLYHHEPDQRTLTNNTTLRLDKPRRN